MKDHVKTDDLVRERLRNSEGPILSPQVEDALRLADEFDGIQPEEYKIPLDALAGFAGALCHQK